MITEAAMVTAAPDRLEAFSAAAHDAGRHEAPRRRLSWLSWELISAGIRGLDLGILLGMAGLAHFARFGNLAFSELEWLFCLLTIFAAAIALHAVGTYKTSNLTGIRAQIKRLGAGGLATMATVLLAFFVGKGLADISRAWIALWMGGTVLATGAIRLVLMPIVARLAHLEALQERIVLLGATERSARIAQAAAGGAFPAVRILGIYDDRTDRIPKSIEGIRVEGSIIDLIASMRSNLVDRVIITLPWTATARIISIVSLLRTLPVKIDLCPADVVWMLTTAKMDRIGPIPTLTVGSPRLNKANMASKLALDYTVASLALILVGPLMLLIVLLIKLDSRGPVLFRQKRFGFNNRIVEIYKFRTMRYEPQPGDEVRQASRNDPRVTRIGRFLRRSSLDELPQLFNVLQGSMSLVGPRPHAIPHNLQYGKVIDLYFARHNVRPGITGWAQVNGLRGEITTLEQLQRRVELDLYYVEQWSLLFDIRILLLTSLRVWFQIAY